MFRIISVILIIGISFLSSSVFADGCNNEWNITESSFKLDLGCMDPVSNGDNNIKWQWGIEVLKTLLANLSWLFLYIIPIIAALSFLVAGYFYIFSAGDSEKVGRAKTIIKWNIVAIFVSLLSYGIINFIAQIFT